MSAVIDLPRARRALAELDRIAAKNNLRPGSGYFTEDDVRAMLNKSVGERQRDFVARKKAAGWVRRTFNLHPDAQAALATIRDRDDLTADEAIRQALVAWAG
jgi:hypothetical protein